MNRKNTPPLVEHKLATTGEIKAASDSNYFEGYGNVASVFDSYDDMVMPGAWAKTVAERKSKVKLLFDHDSSKIIGKPEELARAILRVHEGGRALRESTCVWFADNAQRLSLERSLRTVADAYVRRDGRR